MQSNDEIIIEINHFIQKWNQCHALEVSVDIQCDLFMHKLAEFFYLPGVSKENQRLIGNCGNIRIFFTLVFQKEETLRWKPPKYFQNFNLFIFVIFLYFKACILPILRFLSTFNWFFLNFSSKMKKCFPSFPSNRFSNTFSRFFIGSWYNLMIKYNDKS